MHDEKLWNQISNFKIDDENSALSFSRRLAADNGWSHKFALEVINEYKKFIYLICTGNHPMTPSDEVDQAWHLHLAYTENYWDEFCGKVLNRKIHHGPTKGGRQENDKYLNQYELTKKAYETEFGYAPPETVWPDNNTRFGTRYSRINLRNHWLITKPQRMVVYASFSLLLPLTITARAETRTEKQIIFLIVSGILILLLLIALFKQKGKGGCISSVCGSTGGSNSDTHHNHSDSGNSGGDSGCGSSGCGSGCGGD